MNILPKEEVSSALNRIGYEKEFTVVFMKVDGSQRKMRCMMQVPTGPQKNPNCVPVVDLDAEAWRSFRIDSVINLEVTA